MPRDARAKEVSAWMSRAELDLRAAEVDLGADPPLSADAAFHCQQAVEKALKAVLTHHDHLFRKTHDIGELALGCLEHEPSLEALLRESAPLTEYAWRFRYPGEVFEPDRQEVEDAIDVAHRVVEAVTSVVSEGPA
jgi:HEPN domain-containing protein